MRLDKLKIGESLMMNAAEIFDKQNDIDKIVAEAESQREEFIKRFPIDKIKTMTKDEYVIGNHSSDTFCYYLDHKLGRYGELKGQSGSNKFGVYFSKKDYQPTKKFGNSVDKAFDNVKKELNALLIAGKDGDLESIKKNHFAQTVKNKILSVYYPDKYLSILSGEHIDIFLYRLNLNESAIGKGYEEKSMLLLKYKNENEIMKKWHNIIFVKFLYDTYFKGDAEECVIEAQLNFNENSGYVYKNKIVKERKIDIKVIEEVKRECNGCCQICGKRTDEKYGDYVIEVHHIDYFSVSQNNKLSNLIAVCPNHHRLIHKLNPRFDRKTLTFIYPNGYKECVKEPRHLKNNDNAKEGK